jgi:ABC-type nickel/cobalt efflux system permease component RcnA
MIVRELESYAVPSVMVLVLGNDGALSDVADAVVAGAKRVRFTEVTTRVLEADTVRYRRLDADDALTSYDGIVFVASDDGSAARQLGRIAGAKALTNTVVARAGGDAALSVALVDCGGIVVSVPDSSPRDHQAAAVGERVAQVAGWVRHALGHEAEHHHDHRHHEEHAHDHVHNHSPHEYHR